MGSAGEVVPVSPPLWLVLVVAAAAFAVPVELVVAWAVWLANHRMGPLPDWLTATCVACSATLWSVRLAIWWWGRTPPVETSTQDR
jgi:hypothetical protein